MASSGLGWNSCAIFVSRDCALVNKSVTATPGGWLCEVAPWRLAQQPVEEAIDTAAGGLAVLGREALLAAQGAPAPEALPQGLARLDVLQGLAVVLEGLVYGQVDLLAHQLATKVAMLDGEEVEDVREQSAQLDRGHAVLHGDSLEVEHELVVGLAFRVLFAQVELGGDRAHCATDRVFFLTLAVVEQQGRDGLLAFGGEFANVHGFLRGWGKGLGDVCLYHEKLLLSIIHTQLFANITQKAILCSSK